jgi:hypothetical protein
MKYYYCCAWTDVSPDVDFHAYENVVNVFIDCFIGDNIKPIAVQVSAKTFPEIGRDYRFASYIKFTLTDEDYMYVKLKKGDPYESATAVHSMDFIDIEILE